MSQEIKNILIDFHATICFDYFWRSVSDIEHMQITETLFANNTEVIEDWMIGKYKSEDVNKYLSEKLELDYNYLWNIFVRDCETMFIDPEIIGLLKELRKKYKIYLVTDNVDSLDRFTIPALNLNEVFDDIINSYNHACVKTNGLFNALQDKQKIDFSESIMIDDSVSVITKFETLGGQVYQTISKEDTIDILKKYLAK